MYVIVYQPETAEPEVFGPYETPLKAVQALRILAIKAGGGIRGSESTGARGGISGAGGGLMASVVIIIDGDRHRYQLLKIGSPVQLDAHGDVIEAMGERVTMETTEGGDPSPPSILSGY